MIVFTRSLSVLNLAFRIWFSSFTNRFSVPDAGRYALVLQEGGVVHSSMVGGEESEIVALAHGLVEISQEIGQSPCLVADSYPRFQWR